MGTSPKADMSHLGYRLASLNGLPPSCDIFRVRLAQTGFYYDNSKTTRDASNVHEVVCYSCGITFSQWQKGDNPTTIHQNLRPDCDHLKSITADTTRTGNISSNSSPDGASSGASSGFWPISGSSSGPSSPFGYSSTMSCLSRDSSMQQSSRSSSDSGLGSGFGTGADASLRVPAHTELQADGAERRNDGGDLATDCAAIAPAPLAPSSHVTRPANQSAFSGPARDSVTPNPSNQGSFLGPRDTSSARVYDLEDRPPLSMDCAVYPQFSRHQERRATFSNWPLSTIFHPDDLVMQGFYYAGYADCLRCFYCGVGLKSWAENDDVMLQHIRWRPSCGYVLNTKGRRFVDSVLDRIKSNSNASEEQSSSGGPSERAPQQSPLPTTAPVSNASTNTAAPPAPARDIPAVSTSPSTSSSSSPRPTSAASVTSASGGNAGEEVQRAVEQMGFSKDSIARAVRRLKQSEVTRISTDALVDSLLEQDNIDDTNTASASATVQQNGLDTDGPEEASGHVGGADSERAQKIIRENGRLKARVRCKICREANVGMIFLPCGHIMTCTQCGSKIRNCNSCGQFIRATANVYLS